MAKKRYDELPGGAGERLPAGAAGWPERWREVVADNAPPPDPRSFGIYYSGRKASGELYKMLLFALVWAGIWMLGLLVALGKIDLGPPGGSTFGVIAVAVMGLSFAVGAVAYVAGLAQRLLLVAAPDRLVLHLRRSGRRNTREIPRDAIREVAFCDEFRSLTLRTGDTDVGEWSFVAADPTDDSRDGGLEWFAAELAAWAQFPLTSPLKKRL